MSIKYLPPFILLIALLPFKTQCDLSTGTTNNGLINLTSLANTRHAGGYSVYFTSSNEAPWTHGIEDCKAFLGPDATLACLETEEEFQAFSEWIKGLSGFGSSYLLGGQYNSAKGTFEWANGVPFGPWIPWGKGQPVHQTPITKVNYSPMLSSLGSEFVSTPLRFICELQVGGMEGEEPAICYGNNDLVILVDSSGASRDVIYRGALEFAARLALTWNSYQGNRVSVISFSEESSVAVELSNRLTDPQLQKRIYGIAHVGGGIGTDVALDAALDELLRTSRDVPKNIVLLTFGSSMYPDRTAAAAVRLRNSGILGFPVWISNNSINYEEMLAISGYRAEHIFAADSFHAVLKLLKPVSEAICR